MNEEIKKVLEENLEAIQDSIVAKVKAGISPESIVSSDEVVKLIDEATKKRMELFKAELAKSMLPDEQKKKQELYAFLKAVARKDTEKIKAMGTDVGSEGGYLVPERFIDILIMSPYEDGNIEALASRMTFDEKTGKMPNLESGTTVDWVGENTTIPDSDPVFGEQTYAMNSLKGLNYMPRTMFWSAINVDQLLRTIFVRALQSKKWKGLIDGTGTNQMKGLDTYTPIPRVVQAGATLALDDLVDAVFELPAEYSGNARWIMRKDVAKYLAKKKDADGRPLLYNAYTDSPRTFSLLGYPVLINDYMKNDFGVGADERNIYLGDLRTYWMMHHPQGMEIAISEHIRFDKDQLATRITEELDGRLTMASSFVRIDGVKLA